MELNKDSLKHTELWESKGVKVPKIDVDAMRAYTKEHPKWVHFGAGNIFRGFIAALQQHMIENHDEKAGIVIAETFDHEIIDEIYVKYDNLALLVGLRPDGGIEKEIIASIADGMKVGAGFPGSSSKIADIFSSPELQMVSFTVTEKAYSITDMQGNLISIVSDDIKNGPEKSRHIMSIVASLMLTRYKNGAHPLALVSMDNCSHNGDKLQKAVLAIASAWVKNGFADSGFTDYLNDPSRVAFPWSMIDKITPRPNDIVLEDLRSLDISDMDIVVTAAGTYIAPFVNAEIPQYLVIEDAFPGGRPALEKVGVYFTDRDTVNNTEKMKVTTCLNPLHTALAVFGCLLGFSWIYEEMKDEDLVALVRGIGYKEGLPVVVRSGIIDPEEFLSEVVNVRLPNPFIPDTPQRIATDTSQKIPVRFGETIKSYTAHADMDVKQLTYIPLAIAGWFRYLLGVDDSGEIFSVSADPLGDTLKQLLDGISFGSPDSYTGQLSEILSNAAIFGSDLRKIGLADKIEKIFVEMLAGEGAVRSTLHKYIGKD